MPPAMIPPLDPSEGQPADSSPTPPVRGNTTSAGAPELDEVQVQTRYRLIEALALAERRAVARVENLREVVFEADSEGRLTFLNRAWEGLLGYSLGDSLGRPLARFVRDEDRERCRAVLAGSGPGRVEELRLRHITGSEVWVELSAVALGSGAVVGSLYEVGTRKRSEETLRRQTEETLRRSESGLREARRLAHLGSWEWDLMTGDLSWSDELYRMRGLEPARPPATLELFWSHVHREDRDKLRAIEERAFEERSAFTCDYRVICPDGRIRMIEARGQVVLDESGGARLVGTEQDVTELKEAEAAVRARTEELQVIADAMMVFLAGDAGLQEVSAKLLRAALSETGSACGFVGIVVDGPILRILAHEGLEWASAVNRECYEEARRTCREGGHLQVSNLDNLLGRVVTTGEVAVANLPVADPCPLGLSPGCPRLESFLGVPILRGTEVVGMIGIANRPGGYTGAEQSQIEVLTRATALIYDSHRRSLREAALEEQLRQSQKMEAIGRLAGGVAHDFNNMLGVIAGYSELLSREMPPGDPRMERVGQIRKAAERAASLTRQLLAFSRKQVLQPRLLDLGALVADMEALLRRLIGEDVELKVALAPDLGRVCADPGQVEQVLMNLAANARDAMPAGGKLRIETSNTSLDAEYARAHPGARPGPHVRLEVSDTGQGMNAETLRHIFEPFFTTKEAGKGTGLGLATVYGIVKQSDGYIEVASSPGRGTTFAVYLPRVEGQAGPAHAGAVGRQPAQAHGETILLVEDESELRTVVHEIVEASGYVVLEAGDADEALALARAHTGDIHLLLTDVIMPRMSGKEMADRLQGLRPEMRVLFVSGYTSEIIGQHGLLDPGTHFLQKPFDSQTLLRKLRAVLDEPREHASRQAVPPSAAN